MFKVLKKFQKEILLVVVTAVVVAIPAYNFKKTELNLPYPHTKQLPTNFTNLTCDEVSETYVRAWSQDSDLPGDADNSVQLSVSKSNAQINLTLKDGMVMFTGDYVWDLGNRPFAIQLNNSNIIAGTLATSKEEAPRYDVAGSFMLAKKTSLLILSDTTTMITQNESFGSRSRLFTCNKTE